MTKHNPQEIPDVQTEALVAVFEVHIHSDGTKEAELSLLASWLDEEGWVAAGSDEDRAAFGNLHQAMRHAYDATRAAEVGPVPERSPELIPASAGVCTRCGSTPGEPCAGETV